MQPASTWISKSRLLIWNTPFRISLTATFEICADGLWVLIRPKPPAARTYSVCLDIDETLGILISSDRLHGRVLIAAISELDSISLERPRTDSASSLTFSPVLKFALYNSSESS